MRIRSKIFYLYSIFVLLYAAAALIPRPSDTLARYDLNALQYRLLMLSIVIPLALIWYAAFYGYAKLRTYADTIRDTPDGRHVSRITTGVMILAIGLPVSSLVSSAANILANHYGGLDIASDIFRHYISLAVPLAGFIFIGMGARGLSDISKQRPTYRAFNILAAVFIAISVTYCYVMVSTQGPGDRFHLPVWLLLTTIVMPYLYSWYIGIHAAHGIHLYSRKAPGTLYRQTWNLLSVGVASIIVMQIVLQYVGAITAPLANIQLMRLLMIVYVLLVLMSIGYLIVAVGAKRLQKIEEV